ncbi:methyltransferase domain-containing protein [Burkholderia sp. Bp8963]|uniref:CheR family methyltransferase n=1 Tax=Burkholderia sp. Bp8963 TaxID=2184547 RepID=UPI000F596AD7|nr:CheR family methyltransferase [Burkholderia sp. Bp8963]RQS74537.1 methyltransferase domain-containing protein [Burkholderia sp. Bp8963]
MNADDPRFEAWLTRETGMDATTLGHRALARAVLERARIMQAGAPDVTLPAGGMPADDLGDGAIDAYWQRLIASLDERQALIETLVVPETWFFRDREAFVALARLADARLVREPARTLRVLSAPCSTGEEPYSISMALIDAGIGASRFAIDAVDISARAIDRARDGVYGRNAFRGHPLDFRERHFSETDGGWQLHARVREPVRFVQANLFDLPLDADTRYDFIFCRNVLIYFNRDTQDQSIRLLDRQLADGGTIFVGPAETGLMMRHALAPARIPLAFAFHRAPPVTAPAAGVPVRAQHDWASPASPPLLRPAVPQQPALRAYRAPARDVEAVPRPFAASAKRPATQLANAAPDATSAEPVPTLADARRLADTGRLDDAERAAHAYTLAHGPDADAFHLLGLIADARGRDADAQDFYRKTLYLDPAHYEALTHLAALRDAAGDGAGARQLMLRARRASALRGTPTAPDRTDEPGGTHGSRRA